MIRDFLLWSGKPEEDWKKEVEDKSKDLCLHIMKMKCHIFLIWLLYICCILPSYYYIYLLNIW